MITNFICLNRWSENRPAGIAAKNPIGSEKTTDVKVAKIIPNRDYWLAECWLCVSNYTPGVDLIAHMGLRWNADINAIVRMWPEEDYVMRIHEDE